MERSILIGKPEDWARSTVRGLWRILNWPPKFAARSKLSVRPDALPCPKTRGMVDGAGEQIQTGAGRPGGGKMGSGRNPDFSHRTPGRAVENDDVQRRSGIKVQTEIYQSALTLGV
jgi:hypothetical protein